MVCAPLVSIVINTHNRASFIAAAIDSVYAQTYQNYEIVIYDNASVDSTAEIAARYDGRLKYFRSEEFLPLGRARNMALRHVSGEWIAFLDSDDEFLPLKLERQIERVAGDVALVYCNSIIENRITGKTSNLYSVPQPEGMIFGTLLRNYLFYINTVIIRRDALPKDETLWFPEEFEICEEADLFMRLAYQYPVAYVHEPLAKYLVHSSNTMHGKEDLTAKELILMLARFRKYCPGIEEMFKRELVEYYGRQLVWQARAEIKKRNRLATLASYIGSLIRNPRAGTVLEMMRALVIPFFQGLNPLRWLFRRSW